MKKIIVGIVSLFILSGIVVGQSPKHELRAAWLTTVWSLDWPGTKISETGNTELIRKQKKELTVLLDMYARANMNAVYFQIRSRSDALYRSSYEPWSSDLVGVRGQEPGYDPLAFAVEEAHKRGLELYAWMNPYRYSTGVNGWGSALPQNYEVSHPEWLITYPVVTNPKTGAKSQLRILNPGIPEVRAQLKSIVGEVVNNYDVDGIIFDDYFYGSGTNDSMDEAQFQHYNPEKLSRGDWRRENVNKMIRDVRDTIKKARPYVKFGVSPAGVAASSPSVAAKYGVRPVPVGSDWQYHGIYSDPLAWLSQGTIDFISPQIYWTIGSSNDYLQLSQWWSEVANKFGKHFYASHSLENLTSGGPASVPAKGRSEKNGQSVFLINGEPVALEMMSGIERTGVMEQPVPYRAPREVRPPAAAPKFYAAEIGAQIAANRNYDLNGASGNVFYRTRNMYSPAEGFVPYLKKSYYAKHALPPAINWNGYAEMPLVDGLSLTHRTLAWNAVGTNLRYTVYAVPNDQLTATGNFGKSDYLLGITYTNSFAVPESVSLSEYTLAVAAMDRFGNEFPPRIMNQELKAAPTVTLVYPADGGNVLLSSRLTWNAVSEADCYLLEIAEDNAFTRMVYARALSDNHFSTTNVQALAVGKDYYWRVKARKANAPDGVSDVRRFSIHRFALQQPSHEAGGVSLTPTFRWIDVNAPVQYRLEIATTDNFATLVHTAETTALTYTMPSEVLLIGTRYYVRVKAIGTEQTLVSDVIRFTTLLPPIATPIISRPQNEATIQGTTLEVCWQPQIAKQFKVELSENDNFSGWNVKARIVKPYTVYCTKFTGVAINKTYYVRVSAQNGLNGWHGSDVIKIATVPTSLTDVPTHSLQCRFTGEDDAVGLVIVSGAAVSDVVVKVYSLTGMSIAAVHADLTAGENILPLRDRLPKGIYAVSIATHGETVVRKVIRP